MKTRNAIVVFCLLLWSSVVFSQYAFPQIKVGAHGEQRSTNAVTAVVNSSAGTTLTATNLIPAGSVNRGCVFRVLTAFGTTNGLTSINMGDGTTANLYANNAAITLNATTDSTNYLSSFTHKFYAAATSVVITGNGGTGFDSTGSLRVTCFVEQISAPTN